MPTRRKYSSEFKREAVEMTRAPGVTLRQVARELGLNANMLGRWRREFTGAGTPVFPGQGKPRDAELVALKRDLARVKKERGFLKEAAAFFAKASK